MDRGADDRAAARQLLSGVCRGGIPPLPSGAVRVALDLADDDESNNDDLIVHLELEPRLGFGLLAGANLPAFLSGRPTTSIRQVVECLGRRKCLSLLWLLALSDFLRSSPRLHERAREKLWKHSLLTAVLTQQLLLAAGQGGAGDGLAGGAAHDIGHLLLVSPGARLGIVWHEDHELLVERPVSPAPERDHCRLGASLLAFWDAPPELVACALSHHDPASAEARHRPLVVAVRLADLLAEHIDLDRPVRPLRLETAPAWRQLAALEPWNQIADLHLTAVELLAESLLAAEHLADLLGT